MSTMNPSLPSMPVRTPWCGIAMVFGLIAILAPHGVFAQGTTTYNLPSTSFVGWSNDPCGGADHRGISPAGTVDTGSYTDTLSAGSTVGIAEFTMGSWYNGGSTTGIRLNAVLITTIAPLGGASCGGPDGDVTGSGAPGAYTIGGANAVTLTNTAATWNMWGRIMPWGYVRLVVTHAPTGWTVWQGDVSTDWNNAGNWSRGAIPTGADSVFIPIAAFSNPVLSVAGSCNALQIDAGRTLSLGANTLTVNGNLTNNGTFSGNTGTLTFGGTGAFTNGAGATFNASSTQATLTFPASFTNNGTFNVSSDAVVFGGPTAATLSGTSATSFNAVTFNKTAAVTIASTLTFTASGTITNQGSGTFAPSGGTITASDVDVVNTGTARWDATGGTIIMTGGTNRAITNTSTGASPQLMFSNFTLNKSAGIDVTSANDWSLVGDYTNTSGDLVCTGGTVTLRGGANRSMALDGGTVQFNNLTISHNAATTRTWTTGTALLSFLGVLDNAGAGNFTVTPTWTMTGTDSDVLRNSGTGATTFSALTINKSAPAASVTTEVTAGSMTVTGDFTNTGSGTFGTTSGTLSVNGNLAQTAASVFSGTGGTFRFGGAVASTITNSSTGGITFFNFTIDKSAAVNVTTTNSFTVLGAFANSGAGSFVANQGVETPWQTFQNGTLVTGDGLDYTMGYRFTILVNGRITKLGGRFVGNKTITLWNATTQTVVAQANVNNADDTIFRYSSIPPVNVSVGEVYTVSVYIGGTGGTHRENINTLPRTYGAITIEDSRYAIGNVYPNVLDLTAMWGQVDIEMQALPTTTMAGSGAGAVNHSSSGATTFANLTVNKPTGVNVGSSTNWFVTGNVRSVGAGGLLCTAGSTVTMNGTSQIIDGVAAPQFNNLTIGAGSTTTPTSDVAVIGTLQSSGTWRMTGAQTLTMGSASGGGTIAVSGTLNCSGTTPTIQGFDTTNRMTFNVTGSLNVTGLNFRRATATGMTLVAGSTVVALNNCTFTEAISGAGNRHLSINNAVVGTFTTCSFDSSFGAGNNVVMNNAGANVTMATWTGAGGGPAFHNIVAGSLTWQSSPPAAPTNLLAEQASNPINVLDSRPEFSARHSDPDTDSANAFWIQVSTDSTFATVTHWDSNWVALAPVLANNTQSADQNYGGSFMTWSLQYFWRIRFRDVNGVTGNWSSTANFTLGVPSVTLPNNGWNMVTVPRFDNASVNTVFGDDIPGVVVYEWNETARSWQQTLTIQPGRGYLIFSSASFVDTDTGTARWGDLTISNLAYTTLGAPTQYETATNQFRGWHVIGHPFNPSANWTTIWGGSTNLGDTYQYWNGSTYVWYDANPPTDGGAGNAVPAWRGIWINVTAATNTIVLPNPKNLPEPGEPAFDANYWRLQVQVDSAGAMDTSNFAGVRGSSIDGYDTGEVKDLGSMSNPFCMAYFDHRADWATAPDQFTQQMNQTPFTAGAVTRFPLTVDQNTSAQVTLSFPNFAQMPTAAWAYQLQDMDTLQVYNIGSGFTHQFSPGAPGTKRFDIIATRLTNFTSALNCSTGPQNPAAGPVGPLEGGVVMLQLRMAAANEAITIDQVRVRTSGSGNDATMVAAARLYHDVDRDGAVGPGDALIAGPNVFASDDGNILWWNLDWGIPVNDSEDWLVVYDFNAPGTEGGTFRAWFDPVADVQARGQSSQLLILGSGTLVSGPSKTMLDGNPPGAPALVAPANGATVPTGGPAFDWTDVFDAVSYLVQADNSPDFSSPEVNQSGLTASAYTQATTLPMGTYYWRTLAVDDGGNLGPWSETWSFIVAPASRSEVAMGLGNGARALFADFDDGVAAHAFRAWKRVPWSAYGNDDSGGQTHTSQGDLDGDGLDEVVVGFSGDGAGWLVILRGIGGGHAVVRWIRVPWSAYNTARGTTWPACGSIDNDPRSEIVVGLDSYPTAGGWLCIFDDGAANNALLGFRRLNWAAYNAVDGQIRPATGDVDGDGRDEVVLGLGPASRGLVPVLEDWAGGMGIRSWITIPWPAYNSANGSSWVAAGDTDGDGRAEVVAGLGSGGGGFLCAFDDGASGHPFQSWKRVPWSVYNSGRGETRPAIGNVDGDAREELIVGLGPTGNGNWAAMGDGQEGYAFRAWYRVPWNAYDAANGETWPSIGNGEQD